MMKTLRCMALSLVLTLPALAADYDLVINNGRVIDPETMLDQAGYEAEVAKDPSKVVIIFNAPRKEWLPYWLRIPHMVVAADSMPAGVEKWGKDFSIETIAVDDSPVNPENPMK